MKNELISMVDFVSEQSVIVSQKGLTDVELMKVSLVSMSKMFNYANFLNTPLNISMFVPAIKVGDKWEVLEMPKRLDQNDIYIEAIHAKTNLKLWKQYQTAKEQCLFEGCQVREFVTDIIIDFNCKGVIIPFIINSKTIQDLIKYKPTLTKKGLEVSGLNR